MHITFTFLYFCIKILQKRAKKVKQQISTSIWSAQHPNTGQNIQQLHSCKEAESQYSSLNYFGIVSFIQKE